MKEVLTKLYDDESREVTKEYLFQVLDHNKISIFQAYYTLLENAYKSKCLKLSSSNVVAKVRRIQTMILVYFADTPLT